MDLTHLSCVVIDKDDVVEVKRNTNEYDDRTPSSSGNLAGMRRTGELISCRVCRLNGLAVNVSTATKPEPFVHAKRTQRERRVEELDQDFGVRRVYLGWGRAPVFGDVSEISIEERKHSRTSA